MPPEEALQTTRRDFAEMDRARFFTQDEARNKINFGLVALVDTVARIVGRKHGQID